MKIVDYYEQAQPMADLLYSNGVQLQKDDVVALHTSLRLQLTSGACHTQQVPLGEWAVIIKGADEYALLMSALEGWI